MSQKFDIAANSDNIAYWFLIKVLTKLQEDGKGDFLKGHKSGEPLDIEFKVNGIECPFVEILLDYEKRIDAHVAEKAMNLLKEQYDEKFRVVSDLLYDLERDVKDKIRKSFPDFEFNER